MLLGNTFPPALIRRRCTIEMLKLEEAKDYLKNGFDSYWGHENTLAAVKAATGLDIPFNRATLVLDDDNYPSLNGVGHSQIIVISPTYIADYRPAIGEEVPAEKIIGWQCQLWQF